MLKNNRFIFLSIAFIAFLVDFFSKFIADKMLFLWQKIIVLNGILSIEKVYNTGGAFSILQYSTWLLSAISLLTIGVLFFVVFNKKFNLNVFDITGFGLVAGGAFGNLINRIFLGHVIDFIQLEFINFPIFNFADIFINIGVIILMYSILFKKDDKQDNIL